jgi:hypothetical protein
MITESKLKVWLKTMAEIKAELSDDAPPFIAIREVVLTLPPDIVEYLVSNGIAERRGDDAFFQYRKDLKIPIHIKE